MIKKLIANTDHYLIKALHMAYIDIYVDEEAYKYLAARLKISAWKPFVTTEEMFEIL